MSVNLNAAGAQSQSVYERVSAYATLTKNYVNTHKIECALITAAVGVIAYLSIQNQSCLPHSQCSDLEKFDFNQLSPPNEWTLKGKPNPLTTAFESSEVCAKIQSISTGSLLNGVQRIDLSLDKLEKVPFRYTFYNSGVTPMALAIHSNCQKLAQSERTEIYKSDFDLSKLETLITAAASARNFPLWEELTGLYMKNNGFEALDNRAAHIHTIIQASVKASLYPPSASSFCAGGYGTPYDVTVSLKDADEGLSFYSKISHSVISRIALQNKLEKLETLLNNDKEKLTESQKSKLYSDINNIKIDLQQHPFPKLLKAEMKSFPQVSRFMEEVLND